MAFPVMVLANAFLYEQAPDGSKPVAHREMKSRDMAARMLSAVGELPESDEVALTAEVTDVLTMQDGGPPKGWLAPP